jgi:hypothetical protein
VKPYKTNIRASFSLTTRGSSPSVWLLLVLLFGIGLRQPACAQQPGKFAPVANAPLNTEQVVENLVGMNLKRAQALHAYQGTRIYKVEYRGFPGDRSAEMVVDVTCQSPGIEEFTIRSVTGSKLIVDKVFKKLLQAEQEGFATEGQRRTALNNDNYDFTLVGYVKTPSGSMYVLSAEPRTKDKFLFRGRIWVDAEDFAVARLEVEPAKNPSFWTKNSEIEQVYMKVSDFWLPARNHSVTAIRLGGRAELTIQYSNYQITSAETVGTPVKLEAIRSANASPAPRLTGATKE